MTEATPTPAAVAAPVTCPPARVFRKVTTKSGPGTATTARTTIKNVQVTALLRSIEDSQPSSCWYQDEVRNPWRCVALPCGARRDRWETTVVLNPTDRLDSAFLTAGSIALDLIGRP